jgi:hypothetical protein
MTLGAVDEHLQNLPGVPGSFLQRCSVGSRVLPRRQRPTRGSSAASVRWYRMRYLSATPLALSWRSLIPYLQGPERPPDPQTDPGASSVPGSVASPPHSLDP